MYIILVYDIVMNEQGKKILPKLFKLCKKYLTHIQNSVFEGELSKGQIIELSYAIKQLVRKDLDSVIIFKSRNSKWLEKEMLAKEDDLTSNFL